jgi:hypothetical protein
MAQAEIGALRVRLAMDAGQFSKGTQKAGRSMDKLGDRARKLGAAIGAAFAVGQLTSFAKSAVKAFGVQEDAVRAVEATLKTTGATAGFTSKQLQAMASKMQEATTFGDEEILKKVTNNLLTFGNIVGPVFDRAQNAALDLSQVLGQDLQSSTIQLGKALNDPILGVTALRRVGIAFTQQQTDQIKTLVESNKVMEAQGVILAEVEKFYGQAAEAAAKTTAGQMTQAANAFGDAMEAIGASIAPVVVPAARAIKSLAEAFQALSPETRTFGVVATGVTVALGAVAASVGILVTVLGTLAGPIAATVAAVAVLSGAIVANWRGITNVAASIGDAFKGIYESARKWLVDALEPVVSRVQAFVDRIRGAFASLRAALGLEAAQAEVAQNLAVVTDTVDGAVSHLAEIWNRGAEEGEAMAPEIAPRMAMPMIQTAEQARAAAKAVEDAKNKILQEQEQLGDQGERLAERLRSPHDIMVQQQEALQAAYDQSKISAEQLAQAQTRAALIAQNAYAGMASDIAGSLEGIFGQSKAFSIAQAIINTYEAFTKALAAYPPPWNYAAAAATLAAGLAQVAKIKSTTKNSAGGGGDGGAGAAAGATQAAAPTQQQAIFIDLQGQSFGRDQVRGLIESINDAVADGASIRLSAA